MIKTILHLCADIGSDSHIYKKHGYNIIKVGKNIGVENYTTKIKIHGIIANPVCTDFSTARFFNREPDLTILKNCIRIIKSCNPKWWYIENPATGTMRNYLGKPSFVYQPWEFGSPWTKKTALWGVFNKPERLYKNWLDVPKNNKLYVREGRKCALLSLHKNAIFDIEEFKPFIKYVKTDADFRSLCSQYFANEFFKRNL